MGRALAEAFPVAQAAFDEADAAFAAARVGASGTDRRLSEIVFEGPDAELTMTEHAQPALVAVSTAAARVLAGAGVQPAFVAGHSLGEYSAHVAAGTLTLADAVGIVRRRGRYMQEAVPVGTGAMAAVLGIDAGIVAQACLDAAEGEIVSPANLNGPGQVAIAGHVAAVERASARVKTLGARRVVPLSVSAPFHCALMKPAEERLAPELRALPTQAPRVPVIANVDAQPRRDAAGAIDALVRQIVSPVQWESVVRRLASEGVSTYVEVGPGTVLSGLIRKIHPDARIVQFGSPDQLEAVVTACLT
jgi:[acyl-carrier-protein] S-malonyltransferase